MDADVIVVGAGLAGLAAARDIASQGLSVVILEARDRIGGRACTTFGHGHTHPIEMGAEWIANDGIIRELLESHGVTMYHADGHHFVRNENGLEEMDDLEDTAGALMDTLKGLLEERGGDMPFQDALEACGPEVLSRSETRTMLGYVQGFHAADARRLSTRWLIEVEESQSAQQSELRSDDGTRLIADILARSLGLRVQMKMSHVVERVTWERGNVIARATVNGEQVSIHSRAIVVTLPLPILQANAQGEPSVIFEPPLEAKRRALECLEMGEAMRMSLVFRRAFWTDIEAMPDLLFAQKFDELVPTWWRADPMNTPILIGWLAGPQVKRLHGVRGAALQDAAVMSLARVLDVSPELIEQELLSFHFHDWSADPLTRGAYSYVGVNGVDAWRDLAEPVDGTVFLAGEAIIGEGKNGTMHGAIESGIAAARRVVAALDLSL